MAPNEGISSSFRLLPRRNICLTWIKEFLQIFYNMLLKVVPNEVTRSVPLTYIHPKSMDWMLILERIPIDFFIYKNFLIVILSDSRIFICPLFLGSDGAYRLRFAHINSISVVCLPAEIHVSYG